MAPEFQGFADAGEETGRENLADTRITRSRKLPEATTISAIFFQGAIKSETYHIGPDLCDAIAAHEDSQAVCGFVQRNAVWCKL